jgi:hypothetical protein
MDLPKHEGVDLCIINLKQSRVQTDCKELLYSEIQIYIFLKHDKIKVMH